MANTIDTAFIKQFESEVHMAYQRMGSKLRNTVRTVSNVRGNTVRFQKIGTGSASTKSRNGMVTPMELEHTNVEATMADYYAAEYIDKLDELKTNIDERQAVAKSAAAALGRKTDELLITAMDAGANSTQIADTSGALVKLICLLCLKHLALLTFQKMANAILQWLLLVLLTCSTSMSLHHQTLLAIRIFHMLAA